MGQNKGIKQKHTQKGKKLICTDHIRSHHTPNEFIRSIHLILPSLPQFSLPERQVFPSLLESAVYELLVMVSAPEFFRHSSFAMHIRNKKFSPQKNAGKEQSRKKNFDRFFILYMYVRLIIAETRGLCEFYIKMHHTATFQSETAGQ